MFQDKLNTEAICLQPAELRPRFSLLCSLYYFYQCFTRLLKHLKIQNLDEKFDNVKSRKCSGLKNLTKARGTPRRQVEHFAQTMRYKSLLFVVLPAAGCIPPKL